MKACKRSGDCPLELVGENTAPGYVFWCSHCGCILQAEYDLTNMQDKQTCAIDPLANDSSRPDVAGDMSHK